MAAHRAAPGGDTRQSQGRICRSQGSEHLVRSDRKLLRKQHRKELVKRSLVLRIIATWIITVPASALLAALSFYMLRGMLLT